MTTNEASKLIYTIKAVYPSHFSRYTTQDYKNMIAAWVGTLEDYTYEQASMGLKIYLTSDSKGFPPSPGQVIDCISKTNADFRKNPSALEAWGHIRKALRNGIYGAEAEFDKLTEPERKAIGSAENLRTMAQMEPSEVETVEQSHFVRAYDTAVRRMEEDKKIPRSIMSLIEIAERKQERLMEQSSIKALAEPTEDWAKLEFNKPKEQKEEPPEGMSPETQQKLNQMLKRLSK